MQIKITLNIPGAGEFLAGDVFRNEITALRGAYWIVRNIYKKETGNLISPFFAKGKIIILRNARMYVLGKYEFHPSPVLHSSGGSDGGNRQP